MENIIVTMKGFISTTLDKKVALKFAFGLWDDEKVPVLIKINHSEIIDFY